MTGQSKVMSLIEALTNTVLGYAVAVVSQLIFFPLFNIRVTIRENLMIGAIFLGISLVRSYLFRRLFDWIHRNQIDARIAERFRS